MSEIEEKPLSKYSEELILLAEKDQVMRQNSQNPEAGIKFGIEIDRSNTERLKEIVKEIGWPTISKVGEESSYAAWIIAQHADLDPDFQEYCLDLMTKLAPGDVLPSNIAYLTDRVAVNKGKLQTFGTQFYMDKEGKIKPRPIKDREGLEKRRKEMSLEPFKVYQQKMEGNYEWPNGYINPKIGRFYKVL